MSDGLLPARSAAVAMRAVHADIVDSLRLRLKLQW